MNVCYCSSNSYWKCLAVSVYSLFLNNQINNINLYILSDGIEQDCKTKIDAISSKFKRKIHWLEVGGKLKEFADQYHLKIVRGTFSTYARIILPKILFDIDKIIFLDSDTLVSGDISSVYNSNLESKTMGMVPEIMVYLKNNTFEDPKIVSSVKTYYNAGVVLFDLEKWRDRDLSKKIELFLSVPHDVALSNDQSILNCALNDEIIKIDISANYYTPLHDINYRSYVKYFGSSNTISENEFQAAKRNPIIIHFYGMPYDRPWYKKAISPYRKQYRKIMKAALGVDYRLSKWPKQKSHFFAFYDRFSFLIKACSFPSFYHWYHYRVSQEIKNRSGLDRKSQK